MNACTDKSLVTRAIMFSAKYHDGQERKYTREPYVFHPAAVATIVTSVDHTPEMLAAAWLHDVVEDTEATHEDVYDEFGPEVGLLVQELTNVGTLEYGNRQARKARDRAHLSRASDEAQTIKLADMIHNIPSIVEHDRTFSETYIREKRMMLSVLDRGNKELWAKADKIISHAEKRT